MQAKDVSDLHAELGREKLLPELSSLKGSPRRLLNRKASEGSSTKIGYDASLNSPACSCVSITSPASS
jgi:hypothetical protein